MVQTQQKTACSFIPTATSKSIAKVYTLRSRVRSNGRNERLELLDAKVSWAVLRGGNSSNGVPLPDTDLKDAEWIAELLQHGLLKASFIPLRPQRELRDLTRYRLTLNQERTRLVNRLHKLLEEANLKLSSVLADLLCKTGRMILQALAKGEADPEKLADLGLAYVPTKRDALAKALCGRMHEHQRFVLRELLQMIDSQEWAIARLDRQIEERLRPFEAIIQRLDAITGVSRHTIEVLTARGGLGYASVSRCGTSGLLGRLVSWAA